MPAKKAKASAGVDQTKMILKWLYVAGVIVAGLATAFGLTTTMPWISWILILVGLAAGFLYHDYADIQGFGLRYLIALGLAAAAPVFLGSLGAVGTYVAGFLQGFANFLGPVVLAMAILHFSNKYFGSGE